MKADNIVESVKLYFIEIPKLSEDSDERDMLTAWTEFLKNPESEKVRKLEMSIEEIREAKDELVRISNNKEQREIYEMRSKILKDKVSALNEAERKGIEKGIQQGIQQGILQIVESLLDVLDDETIVLKTGLDIEVVKKLRTEKSK
ncbi:MAG: Rpn family recombination-promoting nuclease/putative transposase [Clostridium sp.]|nr:Rpn family recombination-promoting nuclease/putative transposase [Clostridium sp.]